MILNRQRSVRVAARPLNAFLRRVRRDLGLRQYEFTVCFVSDAEIAKMNSQYRKKTGPTDVLSFPAIEWRKPARLRKSFVAKPGIRRTAPSSHLGDIAIAPAAARRYARKNGRALEDELRALILHGVLHLLGYDHETDHGEMDRAERRLRRRFGLV